MKSTIEAGFKSKRLIIRPLTRADYGAWLNAHMIRQKPQHRFDYPKRTRRQCSRAHYAKSRKRYAMFRNKDLIYHFGIFLKNNDLLIGEVLFACPERFSIQSAKLSYGTFNNHWRQGYGREAVDAAIIYAFKKLKLHRLEAEIEPTNKASLAFIKTLGFHAEGRRRKAIYLEKSWQDMMIYAITAEDRGIQNMKPHSPR